MSCALHNKSMSVTMEKSVQCDDVVDVLNLADTEKENQTLQVSSTMSNVSVPFSATTQTGPVTAVSESQSQPLVKAISEEKHACLKDITFSKRVKDDMNLELVNYDSLEKSRLNFSLNPFVPKPSKLVTVMKFQRGEFIEVESPSSYNTAMSLRDMKKAITAALDSCISQSDVEMSVVPSTPRTIPRQPEVLNNSTVENSSQGKTISPKKTPPKRMIEDDAGINENIMSTFVDNKGKPVLQKGGVSSKGSRGAPKGTSGVPKGAIEGPKVSEKQKKTPEKMKVAEIPNEKLQPAKVRVDVPPPKPKPLKLPQARVKKVKIPDEESIKFANRQREIQRMKKELKERLKREGKDGVDPAARINAWGRTVGVTCTMCGNHVQKSYGCFRRDTAPEKLLHLFTPGMNRIKICRRCLPYKKQAGKMDQENKVLRPGLLAFPNDPRGIIPGTSPPITIAPLPEKQPVSATTLSAIHRKVTGNENNGQDVAAHVNIVASHVNTSDGSHVINSPGLVNNGSGHVINIPGHVNNVPLLVNNGSGQVNNRASHVNTGSGNVNPETVHVIDATAPGLSSEIDLSGESSKGSAIDYIRKLALNLRTNYNPQQSDSNIAGKNEAITPEEQIIKTPVFEHLSNYTPVTPSMNLGNQVVNTTNSPVASIPPPAQWKHVLNQVPPVTSPVTPENPVSFVQSSDGNTVPAPPWTNVPIVLKTQPNMVLTSPGQMPRDSKGTPLQTFVTTANQKDLKLLPTIMVPSQNALQRQGPVLVQIQRVKLVCDKPAGEKQDNQERLTLDQGKQAEMLMHSTAGLGVTDYRSFTESTSAHQMPREEIVSHQAKSSSISDFLSQAKEISPAQIGPLTGNFPALTSEMPSTQAETSTVDLQSIAGDISSSQIETSTGDFQKITEEIASLIEGASGFAAGKNVNIVDTVGHLSTRVDTEQHQSDKPSEGLNSVESNILNSGYHPPAQTVGMQLPSTGGLGVNCTNDEPAVVPCESADITSQGTTVYPSGSQLTNEKGSGQEGTLGDPTNSYVKNVFESQISEEFLPVLKDASLNAASKTNEAELETTNETKESEQSVVESTRKDDSSLMPESRHFEEKEFPNVPDDCAQSETRLGDVENVDAVGRDFSVEMKDDEGQVEEKKDNAQKEGEFSKEEKEPSQTDGGSSEMTSTATEKQAKTKEVKNQERTEEKSASSVFDENVTLDLRRSQRRTASPRKLSPGKSPTRKVEPKVHGTRQQRQKAGQQEAQKDKTGQHGTQKDKAGQHGTQKDKAGQQGTLKDKTGQQGVQRGKTDRQGVQKDEKEPETTQGVKRKRQGRGTRPTKVPRQ